MAQLKLMLSGRMGAGKSRACDYLEGAHGAVRWARSESMKRLAHALADQVGDLERTLAALLPDDDPRDRARTGLLAYIASYQPEVGKPRQLYRDVAQIVMDIDPLAFERELDLRISSCASQAPLVLIDDIRSKSAFEYFTQRGFVSVRVHAPERLRHARLLTRDGTLPAASVVNHVSESELDDVPHDHVLVNESTDGESLPAAIDELIEKLVT